MFSLPPRVCFDKMWTDYENMLPFTFVQKFFKFERSGQICILVPERALQYVGSGKSSCSKLVENAGGVHSLEETRS